MSRIPSRSLPVLRFKSAKSETRTYQFLTYVFGGGVKVKDHERFFDERTPVRAASVRGQLRFWWRACNPSGCKTLQELRQREGEIWGTTSRPSQVVVEVVRNLPAPERIAVYGINDQQRLFTLPDMKEIAYAAFPLQPAEKARRQGAVPGVLFNYGKHTFELRLTYPDSIKDDVQTALWAWETFGGLGARTRRGFGAVQRISPGPSRDIAAELQRLSGMPRIQGVPSLALARIARSPKSHDSSLAAWKEGLGCLQSVRQAPDVGRNPPAKPPVPQPPGWRKKPAGRSRWPEPDAIRRLTGKVAPLHSKTVTTIDAFPRAAFGMPIIFHFHPGDAGNPASKGDPGMDLQLLPVGADRFASPVILRPIAQEKGYFLAVLVLSSPLPPAELQIAKVPRPVTCALSPGDAARIPALKDSKGVVHVDPIERFLAEIKK